MGGEQDRKQDTDKIQTNEVLPVCAEPRAARTWLEIATDSVPYWPSCSGDQPAAADDAAVAAADDAALAAADDAALAAAGIVDVAAADDAAVAAADDAAVAAAGIVDFAGIVDVAAAGIVAVDVAAAGIVAAAADVAAAAAGVDAAGIVDADVEVAADIVAVVEAAAAWAAAVGLDGSGYVEASLSLQDHAQHAAQCLASPQTCIQAIPLSSTHTAMPNDALMHTTHACTAPLMHTLHALHLSLALHSSTASSQRSSSPRNLLTAAGWEAAAGDHIGDPKKGVAPC